MKIVIVNAASAGPSCFAAPSFGIWARINEYLQTAAKSEGLICPLHPTPGGNWQLRTSILLRFGAKKLLPQFLPAGRLGRGRSPFAPEMPSLAPG